jgi:Ca2+-binding RTX toxin-like protein
MANFEYGDESDETFNDKDGISGDVDWVYARGGNDWAYGLGGNDFLFGENGDDHLFGGLGNDYLMGGAGFDELDGGDGEEDAASYAYSSEGVAVTLTDSGAGWGFGGDAEGDTLVGIEALHGSSYDDHLYGNTDENILLGFQGQDTLKGGGGADHLQGNQGNDVLKGGGGADELWGGNHGQTGRDESDTVSYASSPTWVLVSLRDNYAHNGDAAGDRLYSIENLTGSAHSDSLAGDDYANVLIGMGADDTLHGHGDNDTLIGDEGTDWLVGGAGADNMYGGLGDDVYFVDDYGDRITEAGGQGADRVRISISWWTLPEGVDVESVEAIDPTATTDLVLVANSSGNVVIGNDGDNYLFGGGGVDEMRGRAGDDTYWVENVADSVAEGSGQGSDEVRTSVSWTITGTADIETLRTVNETSTAAIDLTGNFSANDVEGNDGSNTINGRDGNDELTGHGGWDLFWFDTPLSAASNVDTITDFNVADDTIILENAIFTALAAGGLSAERFVLGTMALDVDDRILYDSTTGNIFYDSDGFGGSGATRFAQVSGSPALTHLDFIVV